MSQVDIIQGDCLPVIGAMEASSVQCCVTSPPYWGVRKYEVAPSDWPAVSFSPMAGLAAIEVGAESVCLGEEPDLWSYIGHLISVFREVRRVLADDGVVWLNIGDCYATRPKESMLGQDKSGLASTRSQEFGVPAMSVSKISGSGLKSKDLVMVPSRLALALQADGWWVRSHVVWHKTNPMRESVRDRCTCAHETVWQLSKSERYASDFAAIRTAPTAEKTEKRKGAEAQRNPRNRFETHHGFASRWDGMTREEERANGANRVNVWSGATAQYSGAHFAVMPEWLAERCILSGSAEGSVVFDPFCGVATTGLVANRLGRRFIGIELNEEHAAAGRNRIVDDAPLLYGARSNA